MSELGKQFFRSVFSKFKKEKKQPKTLEKNPRHLTLDVPMGGDSVNNKDSVLVRKRDPRKSNPDELSVNQSRNGSEDSGQIHFKNLLMDRVGEIQKQRLTKKQIEQRIIELNGWNILNMKKNQQKTLAERTNELSDMGEYGIRIEELRIGIEHRYYLMLTNVESKLKSVKQHFNSLIDEAMTDLTNNLIFHKTQNLANLRDLEKELAGAMSKQKKKPPTGIIFDMYTDEALDKYFEFMNGFKEEFFGLILSKCTMKNLDEVKENLGKFKNQYLSDLVQAPQKFPSELFRFFEKEVTRKTFHQMKQFGKSVTCAKPLVDYFSTFSKNDFVLKTKVNDHFKSPIIVSINRSLLAVVFRKQFKIYLDTVSDRDRRAGTYNPINTGKLTNKGFVEVASASLSANTIEEFICGTYLKIDYAKEYLYLGGENNVPFELS